MELLGTKECTRCSQLKDVAEFTFKHRATGVLHSFCRACHKAWNRQHYERNRATYIANARRNSARYHAENLDRVRQYLGAHPCVDCGEADPVVLEFDHRDRSAKRMPVSIMLRRFFSWEQIKREIDKCDVRCANCHRRRTALQFGWHKVALLRVFRTSE